MAGIEKTKSSMEQASTQKELGNLKSEIKTQKKMNAVKGQEVNGRMVNMNEKKEAERAARPLYEKYFNVFQNCRRVGPIKFKDRQGNTIFLSTKEKGDHHKGVYEITINKCKPGSYVYTQYTLRLYKNPFENFQDFLKPSERVVAFELITKDSHKEMKKFIYQSLDTVLSKFEKRYIEASSARKRWEDSLASNDKKDVMDSEDRNLA